VARIGNDGHGGAGQARRGAAGIGMAGSGAAMLAWHDTARRGEAWLGPAWQYWQFGVTEMNKPKENEYDRGI